MKVISVVRNFEMYNRLVKNNKFYPKTADFIPFNNSNENKTIPERYNSFLDNYDYSTPNWFVFCHEDWELKENIENKLVNLDKDSIYGPIGISMNYAGLIKKIPTGQIENCDKDGSKLRVNGIKKETGTVVSTLDCQCVIINSSLVKKYNLRFDQNLPFDLYVEDFCINAKEKHNIPTKIIALYCRHWSWGKITDRYKRTLKYLQHKHKKSYQTYVTTCASLIGKNVFFYSAFRSFMNFFYYSKITKKGKLIIKICKIPVWVKRIK